MLAGEYAVLRGARSLALTVNKRLTISIKPASDLVTVHSDIWDEAMQVSASDEAPDNPLLNSIHWGMTHWNIKSADIHVSSEIAISDGLGSSSAVRLGALTALAHFAGQDLPLWDVARLAWTQQREQQGFASGYDFATQSLGGLVILKPDYENWPGLCSNAGWQNLEGFVHIFRGGRGAPTDIVAGSTGQWLRDRDLSSALDLRSEELVDQLLHFNQSGQDAAKLINAIKIHRQLFEENPHFPIAIKRGFQELRGFDQDWTFKTTGAGGEDSILLFGHESDIAPAKAQLKTLGWEKLDANICHDGIKFLER